jgi:hypothetical protein
VLRQQFLHLHPEVLHDMFAALLRPKQLDLLRKHFLRKRANLLREQCLLWTKPDLQERTLSSLENLTEL